MRVLINKPERGNVSDIMCCRLNLLSCDKDALDHVTSKPFC